MKRILPLLLALVMVLSLAAPALAAEDVFEASEAVEAAAPEAPDAPAAPEEAPAAEVPAETPDMPQTAAVEPEDTAEPQTGKLTVLGDTSKLWLVLVVEDAEGTHYQSGFGDIPIKPGDSLILALDYRYTVRPDRDCEFYEGRCFLSGTVFGDHEDDPANLVEILVEAAPDGSCDLTLTVGSDPDAPALLPIEVTAPEGITVKTDDQVFAGMTGSITCDAGYVPFFDGAVSTGSLDMENGRVWTMFKAYEGADSVEVDIQKATGELNITGLWDKVVLAIAVNDSFAEADAGNGLVGGTILAVVVEVGYSIKSDVEPYAEDYFTYDGDNLHSYYYVVPETGDINVEVVKTELPVAAPKSGTGWAYDKTTGDYYYFVDGVQKFDYWASSQRGLWYYIDPNGKLATGFQYVENPNGTGWYMFQTDNANGCIGRMLTGWQWTYTNAGMGWFNTAHGGVNGQCTYTTAWGAYDAATGMWADGIVH